MTKTLSTGPADANFYERPSEDIARDLPGHALATPAGKHTIVVTEGFSALPRPSMQADYGRKVREPGDICVTNFRGWPQLNVVGRHPQKTRDQQLTWLKTLETTDGTELTNTTIVKQIMDIQGATGKQLDFAIDELDGRNVQDRKSPIRIVENDDGALGGRKRVFVSHNKVGAENSVGFGMLSVYTPDAGPDQLRRILSDEAAAMGLKLQELLQPNNFAKALQKSVRLARIIAQLENMKKD